VPLECKIITHWPRSKRESDAHKTPVTPTVNVCRRSC